MYNVFTIVFSQCLKLSLPSTCRVRWDYCYYPHSSGYWTTQVGYMEFYSPVQVSHSTNYLFKSQSKFTTQLSRKVLQQCQNSHVCHRKGHVIVHSLFLDIVWRVFIPFHTLVGVTKSPRLYGVATVNIAPASPKSPT